jgi:hypothetical protein
MTNTSRYDDMRRTIDTISLGGTSLRRTIQESSIKSGLSYFIPCQGRYEGSGRESYLDCDTFYLSYKTPYDVYAGTLSLSHDVYFILILSNFI